MEFKQPLQGGFLVKRYKRFLADIELESGERITAHCPNTGPITGLTRPGQRVWVSFQASSTRKYGHTWEMAQEQGVYVGINTLTPNKIIFKALVDKQIKGLETYDRIKPEAKVGQSRLDFYGEGPQGGAYIEVKNVHLRRGEVACFPDTVTQRGTKHMRELTALARQGIKVFLIYVVQREDCRAFAVAGDIDEKYARAFEEAEGVNFLAYSCRVDPFGITLDKSLPVRAPLYDEGYHVDYRHSHV